MGFAMPDWFSLQESQGLSERRLLPARQVARAGNDRRSWKPSGGHAASEPVRRRLTSSNGDP